MTTNRKLIAKIASFASILTLVVAGLPLSSVLADQVTLRSLTMSSSAASAAGTTYTFDFTAPTATTIKSVNIDLCTTASGACNPVTPTGVPTGLTTTSATLGSVTGIGSGGSWTATVSTNGRLRIANNSNTGSPSAVHIPFSVITNPSTANSTFYARVTTYSDAAWTTPLDTGTMAASTTSQITVTGTVDETLTFCTGTSGITNSSCSGATGTSVSLGSLSTSGTGASTSQIGIATNSNSGYAVTVNGTTLTSGANTIAALASQTASTQNSPQFGINLKANATPSIGSNVSGAGTANPTANYNTADQFRFVTGDQIASKASSDNFRLFTVSYIANIGSSTPAGSYTTALTYIATATF